MGEARGVRMTAPFVGDRHDVRVLFDPAEDPTADQAATLEWRPCDAAGA
jgi:hypothetical protein